MKVGDTVDTTIAGLVVAQAKVVKLEEDRVHLSIPGTSVIMGRRTDLVDLPETKTEPTKEVIIDGADRVAPITPTPVEESQPEIVTPAPEAKPEAVEPAPVVAEGSTNE